MTATRLESLFGPFSSLVEAVGVLVVVGIAVYELAQNRITLGGLLAFLTYLGQLYGPIQGFGGLSNTVYAAMWPQQQGFSVIGSWLTDLLERVVDGVEPEMSGQSVELKLRPFELVTLRFRREPDSRRAERT